MVSGKQQLVPPQYCSLTNLYLQKAKCVKHVIYFKYSHNYVLLDQKFKRISAVHIYNIVSQKYTLLNNTKFLCLRNSLLITLSSHPCHTKSGATRSLSIA